MGDVERLRDREDVQALVALFDTPDQYPAVEALVAIGKAAVPRLIEALLSEKSANASWRASQALTRIDPQHVPAAELLPGLRASAPAVRRWTAYVVQKIGAGIAGPAVREDVASALFPLLEDSSSDVRRYAADALAGVVSSSHRERLLLGLRHEDAMVRQGVAIAFAEVATEGDVEPLLDALRDPEEHMVRMNAAKALGRVGARVPEGGLRSAAVAGLVEALDDCQFGVRSCAAEALGAIGDRTAIGALTRLLDDPQWPTRASAQKALAQLQ